MQLIDLTGQIFGRLTVLRRAADRGQVVRWACRCECGKDFSTSGKQLRNGDTRSCGCWHSEQAAELCRSRETTHGGSRTRLYRIWAHMKDRCLNAQSDAFEWYGGKGVFVCEAWLDFPTFRDWAIANGYADGLTVDRMDSDGPYAPDNCEWVTRSENTRRMQASKHV
ncbi:MAG: hypothetical protein V4457_05990 [Pseudomonadota bacterium]